MPRHILNNLSKIKYKEKILKAARDEVGKVAGYKINKEKSFSFL